MVNALANHGYLPRDGQNVSLGRLVTGLRQSLNLAPDATLLVGLKALETSTTGRWLTFHLDDLARHGVIEHDGSLSRNDAHSGDNHSFDPQAWATVTRHFAGGGGGGGGGGGETVSIETAAAARKARVEAAAATNPAFEMDEAAVRFSLIETCLYLYVFGRGVEGEARTEWVRVLFEQERLPFQEGFARSPSMLTIAGILALQKKLEEATSKLK